MGINDNYNKPSPRGAGARKEEETRPFLLPKSRVREILAAVRDASVDGIVYVLPSLAGEGTVYTRAEVEALGGHLPAQCRATTPGKLLAHCLVMAAGMSQHEACDYKVGGVFKSQRQLSLGAGHVRPIYANTLIARFGHDDPSIVQNMEELLEVGMQGHFEVVSRNSRIFAFERHQTCAEDGTKLAPTLQIQVPAPLVPPRELVSRARERKELLTPVPRRVSSALSAGDLWDDATLASHLREMVTTIPACARLLGWDEQKWIARLPYTHSRSWRTLATTEPGEIAEKLLRSQAGLERQHDFFARLIHLMHRAQFALPASEKTAPELQDAMAKIDAVYQQLHLKVGMELFGGQPPAGHKRTLLGGPSKPDSWSKG